MRAAAALITVLALALAACNQTGGGGSGGGSGAVTADDMSQGNPKAKVTVIEYGSLGCPICAQWNNTQFDAFKAKYIDTGKINYTLREMNFGDSSVAAAGFLLARCAGKDKYFQVVDEVFQQEAPYLEKEGAGPQQRAAFLNIAKSAGFSEDQFNSCVTDDKALNAFNDRAEHHRTDNHIDSTPTFVVNGKVCEDCQEPAAMDKAIAEAQAAK